MDMGIEDTPEILSLPEMFLRDSNEKISSHAFKLFAYVDTFMKVTLRILEPQFAPHRSVFLQTTSLSLYQPNRAILGEQKTFAFVLQNNGIVNLPVQLPDLVDGKYPDVIATYTRIDDSSNTFSPLNISSVDSILKYQVNNDKYWRNRMQLAIPFVPFMSNCKNRGQYIYLHDIIENAENCQLYSAEQTIPVPQFGFMQQPTSDTCAGISFTCIMEEAFFTSGNLPTYYDQKMGTELFYISAKPLNFQSDIIEGQMVFDTSNLIPVLSSNEVPTTQLPKQVNLHIEYQQVDKLTKRLIKAYVVFSQFIYKSNIPSSETSFEYEFILTLHPQDHGELAINFALDIPVYVILSIIIGLFGIAMIFFYFAFYWFANWISRRKIGTQQEYNPLNLRIVHIKGALGELKQFMIPYIPIVQGILFGFAPNFLLLFFLSLAMLGGFWGFGFFECIEITSDGICESSFIEKFGGSTIETAKRRGRLGLAMIIGGLYAIIRISAIFVPPSQEERLRENVKKFENNEKNSLLPALQLLEDKEEFLVSESYDGNTWHDKIWLRGLFIFMTLLIITMMIFVIFLSFSVFYGENAWGFLFALKIFQIFTEEMLKFYVENELLLSTLSCVIAMSLSVSGLGATDFFAFLFNTFINLGISCFEKTNQVLVVELVSDQIKDVFQIVNSWIISFESQEEEDIDKIEAELEMNKVQNQEENRENDEDPNEFSTNQKGENGNSSIFLTDHFEDSFDESDYGFKNDLEYIDEQKDKNGASQKRINKQRIQSEKNIAKASSQQNINPQENKANRINQQNSNNNQSADEDNELDFLSDPFEDTLKELITLKFRKNPTGVWQRQQTRGKSSAASAEKSLLSMYQESINSQLKIFGDFCNNTYTLISTPGQVLALWMFYDANQMFVKWGITKKGLVFYYLFNILNIPFQIVMDILFLKTVEELHDINTLDYQRMMQDKFKQRSLLWKVDEEDNEEDEKFIELLEPDLRYIHRWCFSSQFFFCLSIFIGGSVGVLEGVIMCIINAYNVFADAESFVILLIVWLPICLITDFICVTFIGPKIWSVTPKSESNEEENQSASFPQQPQESSLPQKSDSNNNKRDELRILTKDKILLIDDEGNVSPILEKPRTKSNGLLFPMTSSDNMMLKQYEGFDPESVQASILFSGGISSSRIGVNPLIGGASAAEFAEIESPNEKLKAMIARKKSRFVPPETVENALERMPLQHESLLSPVLRLAALTPTQMINNSAAFENIFLKKSQELSNGINGQSQAQVEQQEKRNDEGKEGEGEEQDDSKEVSDFDDGLTKEISQNRFLRHFIQSQIDAVFHCDISIHNYLLEFSNFHQLIQTKREHLLDVIRNNYEKQRMGTAVAADQQYEKLFNISFRKAILEKEKQSKYQDIKSHFEEHEYHDDKFLSKFLKANKQWLRRNTKVVFEEILAGGGVSHNKREKFKKLILKEFKEIYGEFRFEPSVGSEIVVKNVTIKKPQPLKSEVMSHHGSPVHMILKYWKHRAELLRTATTTVGGLFFRSDQTRCTYCHSNWGLSLVSPKNIEDHFLAFYKEESKKLGFNFSAVQLFEQGYLIFQKIPGPNSSNATINTSNNLNYRMVNSLKNFQEYSTADWDYYSHFITKQQREQLEEGKIFKGTEIFRQKMISQWQDYFMQNANLTAVCFACNDSAQDQFLREHEKRKQFAAVVAAAAAAAAAHTRRTQLDTNSDDLILLTQMSQHTSPFIISETFSPYKANPSEENVIKKGTSSPQIGINHLLSMNQNSGTSQNNCAPNSGLPAGQGDNYQDINSIIEEDENNEDQSGNETDKLSKFGENITHERRKSEEINSSSDDISSSSSSSSSSSGKREMDKKSVLLNVNKSYRSMKSHESKTHPLRQKEDFEDDNCTSFAANSIAGSHFKIEAMNRQLEEENNSSFRVVGPTSRTPRAHDTYQESSGIPPPPLPPFFNDFEEDNNKHSNQEDQNPDHESESESEESSA